MKKEIAIRSANMEARFAAIRQDMQKQYGGGSSRKITFIKKKKQYTRVIHTEKGKSYVIFQKKKIPLQKLKIV